MGWLSGPPWVKELCKQFPFSSFRDSQAMDRLRNQLERFRPENNAQPEVSLVIIAFNEEQHLISCLASLARQNFSGSVELLVTNNNSTDSTSAILNRLGVQEVFETVPGPGCARQAGLQVAKGELVIFGDGDTLYPPTWVSEHVAALRLPGVSLSYTRYSFIPTPEKSPLKIRLWEFLKDRGYDFKRMKRPEMCVFGCSFGLYREPAQKEGFNTELRRGEDGYMAFKMKQYGRLHLIATASSRPYTDTAGMQINDASLITLAWARISRELKRVTIYFQKEKGDYAHTEESLMNREKK